jgi:hypothetical protein
MSSFPFDATAAIIRSGSDNSLDRVVMREFLRVHLWSTINAGNMITCDQGLLTGEFWNVYGPADPGMEVACA